MLFLIIFVLVLTICDGQPDLPEETVEKIIMDMHSNHFKAVGKKFSGPDGIVTDSPNLEPAMIILKKMGGKPMNVVETGTAAWGFTSTLLWDTYIRTFGGDVYSVDLRSAAGDKLKNEHNISSSTHLYVRDSIAWLKQVPHDIRANTKQTSSTATDSDIYESIDLWFLDSWDVDWNAPILAAFHGLFELMAILSPSWKLDLKITMHRPMNNSEISAKIDIESERAGGFKIDSMNRLKKGALIWIDDTPKDVDQWYAQHKRWHPVGERRGKISLEDCRADKKKCYLQYPPLLEALKITHGIFPGKGSFALYALLLKHPEKFKLLHHSYSALFEVL